VPFSKPYMLRSATDAASAAIDYSKGNVEDGVVDSPPSRIRGRTPICSPSPLKRASSSRGRSLSPSPRTDAATSRKLDLRVEEASEHPRLEDDALRSSPILVANISTPNLVEAQSTLKDVTATVSRRAPILTHLPRLEDKRPRPSQSEGAKRTPSADTLSVNEYLENNDGL
jgi:hypothetical protein